ncbi:MAG TPA: ABC transporter substrate-binding protein [Beijerinckiaceae bacterium]|nr:ABC transporter substrate-binding protein [Beijerinckiaceae bacterium]
MRRLFLFPFLILAALTPARAFAADQVTLLLNFYVNGQHAPFYYGLEKGFYSKRGIDLKILEGRGSGGTVQATAAGSATFGYADLPTMVTAAVAGAPVIAVGSLLRTPPMAVISLANHPVRTPADMKGKILAITPGDANDVVFPLFLKNAHLKMGDMKSVVSGAPLVKLDAVIDGRANMLLGFVTTQPMQLKAATGQDSVSIPFANYGVDLLDASIIVRKSMLKSNPDLVRRFLAATLESMKATQADPAAAAAAILKEDPKAGKPAAMLAGLKAALPLWYPKGEPKSPLLYVSKADMAKTLSLMTQAGLIPSSAAADPSHYYTDAYLPKQH